MCLVLKICLSSWFKLYFKDKVVSLYKEPIPTPPKKTKQKNHKKPKKKKPPKQKNPQGNQEFSHILSLCLEGKLKHKTVRCQFPVVTDESCILGDKMQGGGTISSSRENSSNKSPEYFPHL